VQTKSERGKLERPHAYAPSRKSLVSLNDHIPEAGLPMRSVVRTYKASANQHYVYVFYAPERYAFIFLAIDTYALGDQ